MLDELYECSYAMTSAISVGGLFMQELEKAVVALQTSLEPWAEPLSSSSGHRPVDVRTLTSTLNALRKSGSSHSVSMHLVVSGMWTVNKRNEIRSSFWCLQSSAACCGDCVSH